MTPGSTALAYLGGVNVGDSEVAATFGYDKPGTGGGTYNAFLTRRSGSSDYRVKIRVTASDTTLYLVRNLSGSETILTTQSLPGLVYKTGDKWRIRFQVTGNGVTSLRARLWKDGVTEPSNWTATATDSTVELQNQGSVGIWGYLSTSATDSPVSLRIEDYGAKAP